jgi:hypothetical protein
MVVSFALSSWRVDINPELWYMYLQKIINVLTKGKLSMVINESNHLYSCMPIVNVVRQNRRSNQEWTIQRHWQHWVHKTQNEDKLKNTTHKAKNMSNTDPTKSRG